ncbi:MAG: circadian clock protein KaiC [Desulfomonilaceae bacterium]
MTMLTKCPTGIEGFDEITGGGLPQGRPTLVCGSAGCGKTLLGVEFLVRGALEYDEPGVLMAFEETEEDLKKNFISMGFDLQGLIDRKKLLIDHVRIDRSEIEETGEYDLEGLFIRLASAVDQIGAKRVVLDTIEALFSGFSHEGILRSELRRLFMWLKNKGLTAIVTSERGKDTISKHGLEEYVADCVILMDHRVMGQVSTRRLRIVKYRGSMHGADEYPFLISKGGIWLVPITSSALNHVVSEERISTGIGALNTMLEGKGYYRGSSILVSGTAGTGKTSIASHFADSVCSGGERTLFVAFEESPMQIVRNMKSIGINLDQWLENDLLKFHAIRPSQYGLESHLSTIHQTIDEFKPAAVVIDPISSFLPGGSNFEIKEMLLRLVDFLKSNGITSLFTDLIRGGIVLEKTDVGMSSLMDTWLLLRSLECSGERNRSFYIAKSRGMDHSHQIREFLLTDKGVELIDVYVGSGEVLTGSARFAREAQDKAEALARIQEIDRKKIELEQKRHLLSARIAALQTEFEAEERDVTRLIDESLSREDLLGQVREDMARIRRAD